VVATTVQYREQVEEQKAEETKPVEEYLRKLERNWQK